VAEAFVGDVSSEKDAEQMAARADNVWHRLDILVNNAASFHHKTRYALPVMKRRRVGPS